MLKILQKLFKKKECEETGPKYPITYDGFLVRNSTGFSSRATLYVYESELKIVKQNDNEYIQFMIDTNQPKGKYVSVGGLHSFFMTEKVKD